MLGASFKAPAPSSTTSTSTVPSPRLPQRIHPNDNARRSKFGAHDVAARTLSRRQALQQQARLGASRRALATRPEPAGDDPVSGVALRDRKHAIARALRRARPAGPAA